MVITLVGPDRPGLVGAVSDVVRNHGGNWLQSQMSHLAGQFAGIVLIDVSESNVEVLSQGLQKLSEEGLQVVTAIDSSSALSVLTGDVWQLTVVGNDRAGIVREVTQVLASHDVNVEELITECTEAPVSGGQIFRAVAKIRLPEPLSPELLQDELERIATDLMIDIVSTEDV